LEAIVIFKI